MHTIIRIDNTDYGEYDMTPLDKLYAESLELRRLINKLLERSEAMKQK